MPHQKQSKSVRGMDFSLSAEFAAKPFSPPLWTPTPAPCPVLMPMHP